MEYIIIIGAIFVLLIPLLYYAVHESSQKIRLTHAQDAVASLAKTADSVYSFAPGTKRYVWVNLPSGIESATVKDNTISLELQIFGDISEIYSTTKANLTGELPFNRGAYRIPVELLESGLVQIGKANDTTPPEVVWTSPLGLITYNDITLKAYTNEPAFCKYDNTDMDYYSMSNNFSGASLYHECHIGILEDGSYLYYARCIDHYENVMNHSALINFTINTTGGEGGEGENETNETYESIPPVINLISPETGYVDNDSIVDFTYNVTDNSSISFCELIINGTVNQTDPSVTRNITQSFQDVILDFGNYTWNINCTDVHGNKGQSEIRNLTINHTLDYDLPDIDLISPADYTIRNYWLTKFSYNVNDITSGISYCTLSIFGLLDDYGSVGWNIVDSDAVEGADNDITLPLFMGNYTWNVSCVDDSYNANTGYSDTWHLRINITPGEEAFLDSCAGYCGYIGYIDGVCRQNAQKCSEYVGGTWESGGDEHCTVETGDFCCCAQETI